MGEVVNFTGETILDEPPASLLEKAKGWEMERCLVVGFDDKGELRFGGSFSDSAVMLLLLKLAERELIEHSYNSAQGQF